MCIRDSTQAYQISNFKSVGTVKLKILYLNPKKYNSSNPSKYEAGGKKKPRLDNATVTRKNKSNNNSSAIYG